MEWLNEPTAWTVDGDTIEATAGAKTDFWRTTHYGFVRDNGHFFGRAAEGDVMAEVTVRGAYAAQYDQAGLMLRLDETTWLKCGVELVDGVQQASVVVTRDFSDWSIVPLAGEPTALRLRLTRRGPAVEVHPAAGDGEFALLRLAYFPEGPAHVGPMLASPDGDGFPATFEGFVVRDA